MHLAFHAKVRSTQARHAWLVTLPLNALQGVGASLREVGEQLAAIDPGALLDVVDGLPARVLDAVEEV